MCARIPRLGNSVTRRRQNKAGKYRRHPACRTSTSRHLLRARSAATLRHTRRPLQSVNRSRPRRMTGKLGRARFRVSRGAQQRAGVVQDDAHRDGFKDRPHAAFVQKCRGELAVLHGLENLGGDAAAQIDAPMASTFSARLPASAPKRRRRTSASSAQSRSGLSRLLRRWPITALGSSVGHAFAQPGRLFHLLIVAQKA